MNKELQEIKQKLLALNEEKRAIEQKLITVIMAVISETIKECPIKKLGSGCFIVRCSDIIGNPWNPEFYDWEYGAKILIEKLNNVPVDSWEQYLVDLLKGKPRSKKSVYFMKYVKNNNSYKIPINREFIVRIIGRL